MELNQPTTAEYAEAFGIDLPETTPETTTEQPETTPKTEAEQPAAEEQKTEETTEQPTTETNSEQEMPVEERAIWAARRRKWEAKEAEAREAAAQARVDQVYADMFKGQNNPFTGNPITTEAEYKAYIAERDRRKNEEQLQAAGIDPKSIEEMVRRQMEPMRQQMEQAQLSAIREKAKVANERYEAALKEELRKINELDPSIQTLEDIRKMPTADIVNGLVQKGVGLENAFYLANRKAIEERKLAAARAAAQEQMAGKQHLNPVGSTGGKEPVKVPAGVVAAYRQMMPDATDAEIQKAYEDAMKQMK